MKISNTSIALFISFLALLVSWNQTKIAGQTQKDSILPVIEIVQGYNILSEKLEFTVDVQNVGMGVARIQSALLLSSNVATNDIKGWESSFMTSEMRNATSSTQSSTVVGYILPGNKKTALKYKWDSAFEGNEEVHQYLEKVFANNNNSAKIQICYCSIYNDCWFVISESLPQKTKSCGPKADIFTNAHMELGK